MLCKLFSIFVILVLICECTAQQCVSPGCPEGCYLPQAEGLLPVWLLGQPAQEKDAAISQVTCPENYHVTKCYCNKPNKCDGTKLGSPWHCQATNSVDVWSDIRAVAECSPTPDGVEVKMFKFWTHTDITNVVCPKGMVMDLCIRRNPWSTRYDLVDVNGMDELGQTTCSWSRVAGLSSKYGQLMSINCVSHNTELDKYTTISPTEESPVVYWEEGVEAPQKLASTSHAVCDDGYYVSQCHCNDYSLCSGTSVLSETTCVAFQHNGQPTIGLQAIAVCRRKPEVIETLVFEGTPDKDQVSYCPSQYTLAACSVHNAISDTALTRPISAPRWFSTLLMNVCGWNYVSSLTPDFQIVSHLCLSMVEGIPLQEIGPAAPPQAYSVSEVICDEGFYVVQCECYSPRYCSGTRIANEWTCQAVNKDPPSYSVRAVTQCVKKPVDTRITVLNDVHITEGQKAFCPASMVAELCAIMIQFPYNAFATILRGVSMTGTHWCSYRDHPEADVSTTRALLSMTCVGKTSQPEAGANSWGAR